MKLILWLICVGLGWAAFQGLARLWTSWADRMTPQQRSRNYHVAKNLPQIAFNFAMTLLFLAALGATVIRYFVAPLINEQLGYATDWGPGTLGGLLALWLFGFWSTPELPAEAPPRGRSLKRPTQAATSHRGRTIRTFRED